MNLSRHNIQEFCRICLVKFCERTDSKSYNILLLPHLAKLVTIFTSINLIEDENGQMPRSLCVICYHKLTDLEDFRYLAKKSTRILNDLLKSVDFADTSGSSVANSLATVTATEEGNKKYNVPTTKVQSILKSEVVVLDDDDDNDDIVAEVEPIQILNKGNEIVKMDSNKATTINRWSNNEDDDNQLLLPELAKLIVKNEPIDYVQTELGAEAAEDATQHTLSSNENAIFVKNELSSECEDQEVLDSIADDADDEEYTLPNGANNNSSSSTIQSNVVKRRFRDRNKKALNCPHCDKRVYKQVYLEAHIRGIHEGHKKPFLCVQCNKAFTRYHQMHEHLKMHHPMGLSKFTCEIEGCGASFKMQGTLETHRKVKHPDIITQFSMNLASVIKMHNKQLSQEIAMDHICHICNRKYSSKRALGEHLKRHAQIKQHVCKECGVGKVTRTELRTHMRTHETNLTKFKCTICPQEFNHKNAISRHVRVVHEGQRNFSCIFCNKRFGTRNAKICHERLHTGERPFRCEFCRKSFAQQEGLRSHMKNHDTMLRKHVCKYCAKRFITRKNLQNHEERHRGSKPFICDKCSKGFFSSEDLETHVKVHTEDEAVSKSAAEGTTTKTMSFAEDFDVNRRVTRNVAATIAAQKVSSLLSAGNTEQQPPEHMPLVNGEDNSHNNEEQEQQSYANVAAVANESISMDTDNTENIYPNF